MEDDPDLQSQNVTCEVVKSNMPLISDRELPVRLAWTHFLGFARRGVSACGLTTPQMRYGVCSLLSLATVVGSCCSVCLGLDGSKRRTALLGAFLSPPSGRTS
jgi:hypothetical protein